MEDAREGVARLAGVDPRDVVLTGGGTEANNLALRSAFAPGSGGGGLVTSRMEHPSIVRVAEGLEAEGLARIRWLRATPSGAVDLDDLERALREGGVRLVALQHVNHETGVIQPVGEARALCERHDALLHVDAVQAFGRLAGAAPDTCGGAPVTRSLAAHKIRGPKDRRVVTRRDIRLAPVPEAARRSAVSARARSIRSPRPAWRSPRASRSPRRRATRRALRCARGWRRGCAASIPTPR